MFFDDYEDEAKEMYESGYKPDDSLLGMILGVDPDKETQKEYNETHDGFIFQSTINRDEAKEINRIIREKSFEWDQEKRELQQNNESIYNSYSSRSSEDGDSSYNTRSFMPESKLRNFVFTMIGIFIVFQVIVMFSESISWGSLISDLLEPNEFIFNIFGLLLVCPFGIFVGKVLQFIYENVFS